MRHKSRENTIFVQLDNPKLERAIARCAKRLGCKLVGGRNPTDIIAATYFIGVVDLCVLGPEGWDIYLSYIESLEKEVKVDDESLDKQLREWLQKPVEESPLVLIDRRNDFPTPDSAQIFRREPRDTRALFKTLEEKLAVPKSVRIFYCKAGDVHAITEIIEMEHQKIKRRKKLNED